MTCKDDKASSEAAIRELIDRFAEAFRAKDINGVMAPFSPEIVSFDILPPLHVAGAASFVKHWHEFFDAYEGPLHVEFPNVSISVDREIAFSYCLHRIKGTTKSGQKTDWWLRWTACYRKIEGAWLIVHEQVSVPVDLKSASAFLDLKPAQPIVTAGS